MNKLCHNGLYIEKISQTSTKCHFNINNHSFLDGVSALLSLAGGDPANPLC